MYSPDQTKSLQQLTESLLKKDDKHPFANKDIDELRLVLRFHEHRYYILNDPLIADQEYDKLFKALEKMEEAHPDLITADSPTQRVSKGLTKDFPPAPHLVPMLSLENSYNER